MFAVVALFVIILILVLMNTNAFSDRKPQLRHSDAVCPPRNDAHNDSPRPESKTTTQHTHTSTSSQNTRQTHATYQGSKESPNNNSSRPVFNADYVQTIHRTLDKAQYRISKNIHSNEGFGNGEFAEYDIIRRLKSYGIPSETIFHNLYVAKMGGFYSQVDIVVPIDVGILVFEVKDYNGWIYGNTNSKYWTQVLDYGKIKHRFYNPITQNLSHILALRNQQEQLYRVPFFSIIVFHGSAEFKNEIELPDNTFLIHPHEIPKVLKYIRATHNPAPYTNKWGVMEVFQMSVDNGKNPEIIAKHNQRLSQYNNK